MRTKKTKNGDTRAGRSVVDPPSATQLEAE